MTLTPTLNEPKDILAKLGREHARAINSNEKVVVADHLYNFCITSLAVRDHLLEHLQIIEENARWKKVKTWSLCKEVIAAHEIGNSSKHFVLRDRRTKSPIETIAKNIAVSPDQRKYVSANSDGSVNQEWVESVAFSVIVDQEEFRLWEFMSTVREFWETVFESEKVPYEKLPHRERLPLTT